MYGIFIVLPGNEVHQLKIVEGSIDSREGAIVVAKNLAVIEAGALELVTGEVLALSKEYMKNVFFVVRPL